MDIRKLARVSDMANIPKRYTGLNHDIWVSGKYEAHVPRIKVYTGSGRETISMSIEDNPRKVAGKNNVIQEKDLEKISEWIILNKEALLEYWNAEFADTYKLMHSIKSL